MNPLQTHVATAVGCVTDLVRGMNEPCVICAMYRFYLKTIVLYTLFVAANHLGALSAKASFRIGSAAVATAHASHDRGPVTSSMVLQNMSIILQPGDARRADLEQFVASQQ